MNTTAPDMLSAALQMTASLGVVLGLILLLLYGIKKIVRERTRASGGRSIRVLENHYLGVKKSICMVAIPGKVLVLGISADRIQLLDTLDEAVCDGKDAGDQQRTFGPMLVERLKQFGSGRTGKEDR
ncbi:hypothetical protein DESC_300060 [Desulfosarcina cetonica]|uniref:FliO/MopB family protein n=1 Tax=Desulfosarcina cetonica TaxID=90730 RepID=UPI0006D0C6F8|nr:flagellar biosynthetic protein FliO [Desulfosarcina cetonica]VTR65264.1 hypothetical protein DESC_300060 [Desulfosarcina cetonica]